VQVHINFKAFAYYSIINVIVKKKDINVQI